MNPLNRRLNKLKTRLEPKLPTPRVLMRFATQNGANSEPIYSDTEQQVIERHLAEHPEDAGLSFEVIDMIAVSPSTEAHE